jgi:hypothetical protein
MKSLLRFGSFLVLAVLSATASKSSTLAENESPGILTPSFDEFSGYFSGEVFLFPELGLDGSQNQAIVSVAFEPEYYSEYNGVAVLTIRPFYRFDSADPHRTHGDIRELLLETNFADWHVGVGVGKVFWGVAESKHLVDIVNQTDLMEGPNGEAKLGQPMLQLSRSVASGFLDLFIMPYFREREFPSRGGRFRDSILVEKSKGAYENDLEEWHPDIAVRYSTSFANWDLGLAQFYGTSRDPTLSLGLNDDSATVFIPTYEQITQSSVDVQYTSGVWLWKLEGIFRAGQQNILGSEQNYYSFVGGVEHNIYSIGETTADVGLLVEYMRDSRLDLAPDPLHHDVFIGARLGLNDEADSQALLGIVQAVGASTRQYFVEASQRISDGVKATLEVQVFSSVTANDALRGLKDDDFIRFGIAYYY